MQKNTNSIAKLAAIVAGGALVAMSFAVALPAAHAQTTTTTTTSSQTASLEAQIASLQAQLAASQGTSASVTFTRSLTIGSTGADVTALQTWLIAKGYSIPAGATGYFGTQTRAAVAAYQSANGITPAVGYFGPITMAKVNASGGATTTTTTTTTGGSTTLSGGEGSVNNFQTVGAQTATLGTGASQQVAGFQFMAGGSDLNVSRIYYAIYNPNAGTGTTRPWNVFNTATLTNGSGQTVATLDASNQSNYSEDGTDSVSGNQIYRLDFENINQVVKEGTTQQYFLTLSTQGAFASGNVVAGTVFKVGLDGQGLRATDALGLQDYSPSTPSYSIVNVNSNPTGTVTISTGSDNPQTTTLSANQNTATQNVVLNTFTIQNQGSSAVELYTLPINVATTSATAVNLVQDFKLLQGSTILDTESPISGGTATTTFKNLNFVIPAGTTDHFTVEADIQPVGGSNPAPTNSSVTVSVNPVGDDFETVSGSIITPTGASTGYPISFAVNGLSIASAPTSATATAALASGGGGTAQTGTFTFSFNVTAFGQSIYVGSTSEAYSLSLVAANGVSTTTTGSALTSSANRSPQGNWLVNSGQTATFTITATKTGGNSYVYAVLNSLSYGTTDGVTGAATTTLPSTYTTNAVYLSS